MCISIISDIQFNPQHTQSFREGFAHMHFVKEMLKKGSVGPILVFWSRAGGNLSVKPLRSQRLWCLFGKENFPWAPIGANPTRAPARRIQCDLKINHHNSINPFIICIYHCGHLWKNLCKKLVKKACNEKIDRNFSYRSRCRELPARRLKWKTGLNTRELKGGA